MASRNNCIPTCHEYLTRRSFPPKTEVERLARETRYATGKHTAASVQLMAVQVTSNLDVSKGKLWQSILQIVNVTTTCCPENDNTWPSMILCRPGTVQHIQSLSRASCSFPKALKCWLTIRSSVCKLPGGCSCCTVVL